MTNEHINIIGWVLFIISAIGFLVAGWGNFWSTVGSLFFLIIPTCINNDTYDRFWFDFWQEDFLAMVWLTIRGRRHSQKSKITGLWWSTFDHWLCQISCSMNHIALRIFPCQRSKSHPSYRSLLMQVGITCLLFLIPYFRKE